MREVVSYRFGQPLKLKKRFEKSRRFLPALIISLSLVGVFTASTVFGGGPPPDAKIDQCDNGGVSATYVSCDNPGNPNNHWGNGALNSSKAHWQEGDVLPYRAVLKNLNSGVNTVTFSFDTTKASEDKHAIDYLASYDYTETTGSATSTHANQNDPCGDVFACTPSSPTATAAITVPSYFTTTYPSSCANGTFSGSALSGQFIKAWSAVAGGVSAMSLSYPDGAMPTSGDCSPSFKITFTVAAGTSDVVIAWGGHIAANLDPGVGGFWGAGNARPTGSPYHMRAGFPQESPVPTAYTVGSQDLQLSSDAIIIDPRLTLVKTVINDNGGNAATTDWTLTATGPTPISGATGSAAVTDAIVDVGTYTLSENGGPAGYTGGTYSCVKNNGNPVVSNSIELVAGDVATCTVTNNDVQSKLTVTKVVTNDNGGSAVVADLPLFVGQTSVTSGAQNGFSAGGYTVSETGQTGYTTTITGDCAADGSITLAPGDVKSCTITNDDIAPTLTLTKTVVNDNGGSAVVADFPLFVDQTQVTSDQSNTLSAGPYTASETNLSGYTASGWGGDCASDGSVTLAVGDNKTCTITNDDQSGTLIVNKVVINDNNGTAVADDFVFQVNGGEQTPFSGGQKTVEVNAGVYTVTEPTVAGYDTTYDNCIELVIPIGGSATCTITNNDTPPGVVLGDNTDKEQPPPVVLGDSTEPQPQVLGVTLSATGSDIVLAAFAAAGLIVSALLAVGYSRFASKRN